MASISERRNVAMASKKIVAEEKRSTQVSSSAHSQPTSSLVPSYLQSEDTPGPQKKERRSLVNLCLGVLGRHLEDILEDIGTLGQFLPCALKMSLMAIARRRGLLNDEVLLALIDESSEILDVSGSDVTDVGMKQALEKCNFLKAIDISKCDCLTAAAVKVMVQNCPILQTIRCGGSPLSNSAARRSLEYILPGLKVEEEVEDSWETLEMKQIGRGAQSLRWLVWPTIDEDSHKQLAIECPKIAVNPTKSSRQRSQKIPLEALPEVPLDSSVVMGIDPDAWAQKAQKQTDTNLPLLDVKLNGLSIAERFRLAFTERDERLASKRAKNMRQNQRRAEKAWLHSDTNAKALFWAGLAQRSLKK